MTKPRLTGTVFIHVPGTSPAKSGSYLAICVFYFMAGCIWPNYHMSPGSGVLTAVGFKGISLKKEHHLG